MNVGAEARLSMTGCILKGCKAMSGHGGGVFATDSSKVHLTKCALLNCTAKLAGGAMAAGEAARVQLKSCLVDGNFAEVAGGGVHGQVPLSSLPLTAKSCATAVPRGAVGFTAPQNHLCSCAAV
jgi:hypothetical protein